MSRTKKNSASALGSTIQPFNK